MCDGDDLCTPPPPPPHSQTYSWENLKKYLSIHIDDLFLIWTGTKEQFKDFVTSLNSQHPSIKFSYQISNKSINFLDATVYIKNKRLHTTIFTKPTDKQNYLHYKSEHPLPLKNNIPFGQILRIKRICLEALEFLGNCTNQQIYPKRLSRINNTRSILQDHLPSSWLYYSHTLLSILFGSSYI